MSKQTVVVESTSKKIKVHQMLAAVLFAAGCYTSWWAMSNPEAPDWTVFGPMVAVFGLLYFIATRAWAWWKHG